MYPCRFLEHEGGVAPFIKQGKFIHFILHTFLLLLFTFYFVVMLIR